MIMGRDNIVAIARGDGGTGILDVRELEGKLIRCFLSVGVAEPWVAEDIAMAIESGIAQAQRQSSLPEISPLDLDRFVVRTLEVVGFPEAADSYRRQSGAAARPPRVDEAAAAVASGLGLGVETAATLATRALAACESLGITAPGIGLIVELARNLGAAGPAAPLELSPPVLPQTKNHGHSPWLLERQHVAAALSPNTRRLVDDGILRVNNVSGIFPAVKVDVDLARHAEAMSLEPPLTELAFYPSLRRLAAGVDETVAVCRKILTRGEDALPLYLKLLRSDYFAGRFFLADSAAAEPAFAEMVDYFRELILSPVRKVACR